jgi:hypothetical protein
MAPTGVDCHALARWLITPLAASPASFQPSKAAMTAGELSFPMPSNSISDHLLRFLEISRLQVTCPTMIIAQRGRRVASCCDGLSRSVR